MGEGRNSISWEKVTARQSLALPFPAVTDALQNCFERPASRCRLANPGRIAAVLSYTISDLRITFFDLFWLPSEQE